MQRAELTYIVIIGDSSKLELKASDESGSEFIKLPRQYVAVLQHNVQADNRGKRGLTSRASHGICDYGDRWNLRFRED